ncbi:integrin alpha-4 [Pangasianodon hypophthalmus]|uniref:integrin alpha-4 n=1 Tax=Pangasianodon hypophthalmus TaxID=310915 RepID=UPI002307B270|nr:integrin alpha-4 [Pangasianodon hypophthalmus]
MTTAEDQNRRSCRWRVSVLLSALCCACCLLNSADCYNLDVDNSVHFEGPKASLFGYSVLLHKHQQSAWLIVGAPVADSEFFTNVQKPGAIFKCNVSSKKCEEVQTGVSKCGKTCQAESDNQWLGVSLSRRPSNGDVLACGHRWKNVFFSQKENQNKLPHGVCFQFNSDFNRTTQYIPCYRDHQRKFGEDYGSCQAGISNFLTEDLMIMGAPGSSYWTGSVLVYNMSSKVFAAYVDDDNTVLYGSYLGYSVSAGHFVHPNSMEIVGGAPQHGQTGKAYIFTVEGNTLKILNETSGFQLGSYYGASVCAVDLNADGFSDLLVGAPMFSTVREEGRVYVYINQGKVNMREAEFMLMGSDSYAARFGETITDLGDIDDDGYPDVAIGAPQEEDLHGAIYIYNGRKSGITSSFSQRITGSVLGHSLSMFGQSISGGIDVDGNGYPDIAVGAFLSDAAVVLRTRPVVMVEVSLFLPVSVNRSVASCVEHGLPAVCMEVNVCFIVQGKAIPGLIELKYNLSADVKHKEPFPSRFYFHANGTSNVTAGRVRAKHGLTTCSKHQAFMRRDVRDIFTPLYFDVQYELGEHSVESRVSSSFPPLKAVLQQRDGQTNRVTNQTQFARYCAWENCSTNLQVSAHLVLPQSYNNMKFFAVGNGKTIMLNATLVNVGDDAFLPKLHVQFPNNLHFIRVLDAEEKHVSCEIIDEEKTTTTLDCNVANLYIPALSKLNISFLLDVKQNSSAGDLSISINATSENYENEDLLHDNVAYVTLPLRYGVDFNVHGFVSPSSFIFGDPDLMPVDCYSQKFNYTFKVMNLGPSKALAAKVEIDIPHVMLPYPDRLIRVTDLQTTQGHCHVKNSSWPLKDDCDVKKAPFYKDLVFYLSKITKRTLFCVRADGACMIIQCSFGNMDIGKEVTINIEVELNPDVLQISPGRHAIMQMDSIISVTSPVKDSKTIIMNDDISAVVKLEAHNSRKLPPIVDYIIIGFSLFLGLFIFGMLVFCLWKAGFFKRKLNEKKEKIKRESWDYVPKSESFS